MTRILTVIGARPQFIKAAAVSRKIAGRDGFDEILVHTGQHYDANMSDIFYEEMGIPEPKHHLDVSGGSHGQMTGRMLERFEAVLQREKPDAFWSTATPIRHSPEPWRRPSCTYR